MYPEPTGAELVEFLTAPPPQRPASLQLVEQVAAVAEEISPEAAARFITEIVARPPEEGGRSREQLHVLRLEDELWGRRLEQYSRRYHEALALIAPFMQDGCDVFEGARRYDAARQAHETPASDHSRK